MDTTENLKTEIESAAAQLGLEPTTIGRLVGQGGHFYRRLCDGKRVWPETADAVRAKLAQLKSPSDAPQKEAS